MKKRGCTTVFQNCGSKRSVANMSKGKKIGIIIAALVIIFVIIYIIAIATGAAKIQPKESSSTIETSSVQSEEISSTNVDNSTTNAYGTSQDVDNIALQAKEDAANIDEAKTNEAINYIKDNYNNYFASKEVMEQTMYYGYLLEYAYQDTNINYANLGQDAYQVVKYVYRGTESADSQSVKANLEQIQKDLDALE